MKQTTGLYPCLRVDSNGSAAVGQAGGVVLVETIRTSGLDRSLQAALASWRKPLATHDPAKVLLDVAVGLALGGDCLADVNMLRAEPGVFGRGRFRSHCVPADRHPRRRCRRGADSDRVGARPGPGSGVGTGRPKAHLITRPNRRRR